MADRCPSRRKGRRCNRDDGHDELWHRDHYVEWNADGLTRAEVNAGHAAAGTLPPLSTRRTLHPMPDAPTIGRIVTYRTDGRNGLEYDLPAIVTVTRDSHPGDYPGGESNPLPVPDEGCLHLTVFTPGGFGTVVAGRTTAAPDDPAAFVGAAGFTPGSGTYVELNVPPTRNVIGQEGRVTPRSWRWPDRARSAG